MTMVDVSSTKLYLPAIIGTNELITLKACRPFHKMTMINVSSPSHMFYLLAIVGTNNNAKDKPPGSPRKSPMKSNKMSIIARLSRRSKKVCFSFNSFEVLL